MSEQLHFDAYRERRGLRAEEVVSIDSWPLAGSRPSRARRSDPASSHASADELEASGRAGKQLAKALNAVGEHPGKSARELALLTFDASGFPDLGSWNHCIGRRLPELHRRGLVKRSGDEGMPPKSGALLWWQA